MSRAYRMQQVPDKDNTGIVSKRQFLKF